MAQVVLLLLLTVLFMKNGSGWLLGQTINSNVLHRHSGWIRNVAPFDPEQQYKSKKIDETGSIWTPEVSLNEYEEDFETSVSTVTRIFKLMEQVIQKQKTGSLPYSIVKHRHILLRPKVFEQALAERRKMIGETYLEGDPVSEERATKVEMVADYLRGVIVHEKTSISRDKVQYILNTIVSSYQNESKIIIDNCFEKLSKTNALDEELLKYLNELIENESKKCGIKTPPFYPETLLKQTRTKENKEKINNDQWNENELKKEDFLYDNNDVNNKNNNAMDLLSVDVGKSGKTSGEKSLLLTLLLILRNRIYVESEKGQLGFISSDDNDKTSSSNHQSSSSSPSSSSFASFGLQQNIHDPNHHSNSKKDKEEDKEEINNENKEKEKLLTMKFLKIMARAISIHDADQRYEYLESVLIEKKFTLKFMKFANNGERYLSNYVEKTKVVNVFDALRLNNDHLNKIEDYDSRMNKNNIFDTALKDPTLPENREFKLQQAAMVRLVSIEAKDILQRFI